MIKTIKTPALGEMHVILDDIDYFSLSHLPGWAISKIGNQYYASLLIKEGTKWTRHYVHRLIMKPSNRSEHVDHINHNGLDNRRQNLRIVSQSINLLNIGNPRKNKTGYPGVLKRGNRYRASIQYQNKYIHGGYFSSAEEAFKKIESMKQEIINSICQK